MSSKKDRSSCSDADRRLFLEALGEFGPEPKTDKPSVKPAKTDKAKSNAEFLEALDTEVSQHPEFFNKQLAAEVRTPRAQTRSAIEATLDLHASTLELALRRTEEFLLRCHIRRFRRVLIIHGKGAGILKDGVRRYLEHHHHVAQLISANKSQGGDGAVVVILRRER